MGERAGGGTSNAGVPARRGRDAACPYRNGGLSGLSRGGGANRPWPGGLAGGDGTRSEPRGCGARLGVQAALRCPVRREGGGLGHEPRRRRSRFHVVSEQRVAAAARA